jgi:hypothetical protein
MELIMNMKTLRHSSNHTPARRMAGFAGGLALAAALAASSAFAQQPTQDGITLSTPTSGTTRYLVGFADIWNGVSTTPAWFEVPYTAAPYRFSYVGTGPVTLSNVGFFTSPTEIPLDQLNTPDLPPTGSSGSPFNPNPYFDSMLNSGGSETSVPDASATVTLLGLAFGGMTVFGRRIPKR